MTCIIFRINFCVIILFFYNYNFLKLYIIYIILYIMYEFSILLFFCWIFFLWFEDSVDSFIFKFGFVYFLLYFSHQQMNPWNNLLLKKNQKCRFRLRMWQRKRSRLATFKSPDLRLSNHQTCDFQITRLATFKSPNLRLSNHFGKWTKVRKVTSWLLAC